MGKRAKKQDGKLKVVSITFALDGDERAKLAEALKILLSTDGVGDGDDHSVDVNERGAENDIAAD